MKNYEFWLNQINLDPDLKAELLQLNEEQIKESFYTDLGFGTGGMRGLMGVGTNRINLYTIRRATLGFARYIKNNHLSGGVAISYDNRKDSKVFAYQAAMVLAQQGIDSYLFEALRPTPMLSFAVRYFHGAGGIMITASHNPKEYNGYKAYDYTGAQLCPHDADLVIAEINHIENPFEIELIDDQHIQYIGSSFDDIYLALVETIRIRDDQKTVKIVYSPLHGAGGPVIPKFIKSQGYDIYPYEPQMIVDPAFSNTKSSNPEEAIAFEDTISYAKKINADIVMITDPDADRLGIAVLHQGKYQLLTGNQTAAIELFYILNEKKKNHSLPNQGYVYTTNVTSKLIDVIAHSFGMHVITTLTGFKFIGQQAEIHKDQGIYMFGCEESYGSLVKDFVRDKDAVQAVFILAEIANFVKLKQMTIIDYLNQIYQTYGYYYEFTKSITLKGMKGLEQINNIMEHFRANPPVIEGIQLVSYDDVLNSMHVQDKKVSKLEFPVSNVLKYDFEEDYWIVFRPSGTEPKIKIYYGTKKQSMEEAKNSIEKLNTIILNEIEAL
ncbi:MAG: phospho-sugar mutase [Bacillota bacterium]